jgi:phage gpG-like protein
MGIRLEAEIRGLPGALAMARKLRKVGEDLEPILAITGSILEASTLRRFDEERDVEGVPWPPSKAALGLARRASGKISPGRTLFDTGGLEGSIRHEVRPNEVEVGVDARTESAKWGYVHQFGFTGTVGVGPYRRVINEAFGVPIPQTVVDVRGHSRAMHIPKRSFIGVSAEDEEDLDRAYKDHLTELFDDR